MSKTSLKTTVEWREIPWRKLERKVFKLQKRIYQASSRGDVGLVRRLQKLLMKSWSAKCIAVRRVTQDNQGKKTAGVDGVKSLSPEARLRLVCQLKLGNKSRPTRRVWIPKPGTEEKRPLGIPTMYDRALQALVKLGLEPEWEARFEPNSYGFRPGRSCQDAIQAIFNAIRYKPKYVLDADIAKCFDRINHTSLLRKLNTSSAIRRQIRAWLKAGVIDWKDYANRQKEYSQTTEGTPQGGVISPLLANVALHGMEERIKQYAEALPGKKHQNIKSLSLIRYADDFVILHKELPVILGCREIISEWLEDMGLELKPSKTKISHTLEKYEGNVGFDFLGFTVRQFAAGKYRSGKLGGRAKDKLLGFKTIIRPARGKIRLQIDKVGKLIEAHKAAPQEAIIVKLNPVIRGWANYYSNQCSKKVFKLLDHIIFRQLFSWAKKRHRNKPVRWIVNKYWNSSGINKWVFGKGKTILSEHQDTEIVRYTKVADKRSPFDGDWVYWSARMGKHPECDKRTSTLLKYQKGRCKYCGLFFKDGDLLEIDHIIPKSQGGRDEYKNLQVLHRHCHDEKTANDGSIGTKSGCNSTKPKSSSNKRFRKSSDWGVFNGSNKFSHLDYGEVWRKGTNGEEMTPEEKEYFRVLTN